MSWLTLLPRVVPVIVDAAVAIADGVKRIVKGKPSAPVEDDIDAPPVTALSHRDVEHQQAQIRSATTERAPPPSPRRQPLRPPPFKH